MDAQANVKADDEHLMILLGRGQSEALDELMLRHSSRIRQVAYRILGKWDDADDVVQETFSRVLRFAPRYRPDAKFTTWLFRITVNLSQDVHRRNRRDIALKRMLRFWRPATADDCSEREEMAERARKAIAGLAEFQRVAVVLHYYEKLTCAQIGEIMGKSPSAVESALSRAYATLRQRLARSDGNSRPIFRRLGER
jgi:RNA polymerase sigma-70 factor (ECF subfamily)